MRSLCLFLGILFTLVLPSQTSVVDTIEVATYQDALEKTFGLLPKSHYPSGFLLNKASATPKVGYANGTLNDSSFNMIEWYFIQNIMKMSANNPDSITGYLAIDSIKNKIIETQNICPFGMVDLNAQVIRDSAFIDGSMIVSNYRFVENTGDLTKLYRNHRVFSVCPLNIDVNTLYPEFILKPDFVFSNNTHSITSFEIDLGDGDGYRIVSFNAPFQGNYSSGGYKNILSRVAYNNGDTLFSRSEIYVNDPNILNTLSSSFQPYNHIYSIGLQNQGANFHETYPSEFSHTYNQDIFVDVGVWWGCGNNTGQIRKPFLIFAGYNPKNGKSLASNGNPHWINDNLGAVLALSGWRGPLFETYNGFFTDASKNYPSQLPGSNGNEFLNKVRQEGYDILIVQFIEGIYHLQTEAFLVTKVINDLNNKINNSTNYNPGTDLDPEDSMYPYSTALRKPHHEIVVAGYSAGALASRLGLVLMEYQHEKYKCTAQSSKYPKHRVKMWIAFDHEAQGSNVPIGFQMFLDFQKSMAYLPANFADIVNSIICNTALGLINTGGVATQNTLYHIQNMNYAGNSTWSTGHHYDFDYYFNDLSSVTPSTHPANLKGYPKDCYRIAVSQGNANGISQLLSGYTDLLKNESPTHFCLNPAGTLFGVGTWKLKITPYREATARVLSSWNNDAFDCRVGSSIRTIFYSWHIKWGHGKYHKNNFITDQYFGNHQTYDVAAGSTLPSHLILGKKAPLSSETPFWAALTFCNLLQFADKQHGFCPTGSGLDLHLPGQNNLPRLPNLALVPGNVQGGMNLMQRNNYPNFVNHSPNNDFGYPHLTFPNNYYDYTPFDAIWAHGDNISTTHYDDNTMHVEDPTPHIGEFLSEEIAPHSLYLSNRTIKGDQYLCGDAPVMEKYYADFEARNSVLAGNQSVYQHEPDINNPSPNNWYSRQRTPQGDFIIGNGGVVTIRANNADGISKVVLGPGFSAKHGSIFRAYVYGDAYCGPFSAKTSGVVAPPPVIRESRPVFASQSEYIKNTNKFKDVHTALKLYPNPTNHSVYYSIPNNKIYKYSLCDVTGKIIYESTISASQNEIILEGLMPGLYFITIHGNDFKLTDRVILQ